ncbi:hypothetical protein [Grimontia sp. NTOU-MAR1]|uniref:hypothetical protein n=1 Tax=Grimontia sp. NTOU-MAR1 TaxID=3111011 RepID=UPI002DBF8ED8|nr:hypothetical protein [Grimontia sp. NTOU-MAR1]WRV96237.1 hypothetical protein VP504_00020 [Grimontia sp. NTOU-MAR1]
MTDQDGNVIFASTVTQAMLDNGLDLSIDPPATGAITIGHGHRHHAIGQHCRGGSDNATLDYGVGSGGTDGGDNNDGYINDAELNGQIDITVTLGAGTAVGDTLVVTDQDGNTLFSGPSPRYAGQWS